MNAPTSDEHSHASDSLRERTALWDAVAEFRQCCETLPECDSTGKLRGKLGRLIESLRLAENSGDLAEFRRESQRAGQLVQRIHDSDPVTRLLACVNALNRRING
jgi:hypothetical protein